MGFDPQFGLAEETTPGVAVTPTRFFEAGSFTIADDIDNIEFMGLRPGRKSLGQSNTVPGKLAIAGDLELPIMNKGCALLTKHMLGAIATTTPTGATIARDHTATQGTLDGDSLTMQEGVPLVGGATQAFTFAGCKFSEWELSQDTESQLMLKASVIGQSGTTATALATATYPTAPVVPYPFTQAVCTVGGSAFSVKNYSLKASMALSDDRYFLGSASRKETLDAGIREYTGELMAEFENLTAYNRFKTKDMSAAVVVTFTSPLFIEGAIPYVFEITLPNVRWDGETPKVTGQELVQQPLQFKVVDGGGAQGPVIIRTRNGDAAP